MLIQHFNRIAAYGLLLLLPLTSWADAAYMNHADIRQQVKQYLLSKSSAQGLVEVTIEVGHIDSRLRLARCSTKPELMLGNSRLPGNLSVAVHCNSNKPWKIYIQATVNAYQMIYVAQTPIARGAQLNPNDLILQKHNISTLNGNYVSDIKLLKGQEARRNIRKGEIIKPFMVAKSKLIKRGEQVTILAETSGITVRMIGKALNDASAGEQVRVKNNTSKRIIEGTAVNRGIVKINM